MQPEMIKKDRLYITGYTGDGTKTGEVWNNFDSQYNKNPFSKSREDGYEIRFWAIAKLAENLPRKRASM